MTDVHEQVLSRMRSRWTELTDGEKAVAEVLAKRNTPIMQADIARSKPFLGAHPRFENYPNRETTLRCVRQIIHDLKVKHGIVIVSSPKGYWIPTTVAEAEDYLDTMERQARASARSFMETATVMGSAISGLRTRTQQSLFEDKE